MDRVRMRRRSFLVTHSSLHVLLTPTSEREERREITLEVMREEESFRVNDGENLMGTSREEFEMGVVVSSFHAHSRHSNR